MLVSIHLTQKPIRDAQARRSTRAERDGGVRRIPEAREAGDRAGMRMVSFWTPLVGHPGKVGRAEAGRGRAELR